MEHWIVVPSHRLMFCRIEKVMNSIMCDLFCSLNKQWSVGARVQRQRLKGTFDFEQGCDWLKPQARKMGMSAAAVHAALVDDTWVKAVFYRDPLARFLSAFLSKCTDGHDPEWDRDHICKPIFGSRAPTFGHAAFVVSRSGYLMPRGIAGDHWRL